MARITNPHQRGGLQIRASEGALIITQPDERGLQISDSICNIFVYPEEQRNKFVIFTT